MPTYTRQGSQMGKEEEDQKRIWRNYSWTLSKPKEGNRYTGIESGEGPGQDKPNKPTPKHIIIKMTKVKEDSKVRKRKTKSQLRGNPHRLISLQKICKPEYIFCNIYSEFWKGKACNLGYSPH